MNGMPDMPVNVPVDDPNADTEWNDILRKHGVIPEKPPSPTPIIQEALIEAKRQAHENRLDGKDLDELDELEEDEDEEFLEKYRKQRMTEINELAKKSVFNQVYPVQKVDYSRDVTEASNDAFVLVLLTSSVGNNTESALMTNLWRQMAAKYGEVKFCQMQANLCIEGYPDRNTPTILVYRNGDIKKQVVTLKELTGTSTSISDVEKLLIDVDAIKFNDQRMRKRDDEVDEPQSTIRRGKNSAAAAADDDDSDWD